MLFVEPQSATLAVVEAADGSIVDLHRHQLATAGQGASHGAMAAELATMVAGLDARGSRADGVFLIGCGTDIVSIKPALEAATSLEVTAPEEPDMALARGAALASANAPLFASSTAALAYALDPGTGEMSPRRAQSDLPRSQRQRRHGRRRAGLQRRRGRRRRRTPRRRRASLLAGSALAGVSAIVAAVLVVALTSDRPASAVRHNPRVSVATPVHHVPAQAPSTRAGSAAAGSELSAARRPPRRWLPRPRAAGRAAGTPHPGESGARDTGPPRPAPGGHRSTRPHPCSRRCPRRRRPPRPLRRRPRFRHRRPRHRCSPGSRR